MCCLYALDVWHFLSVCFASSSAWHTEKDSLLTFLSFFPRQKPCVSNQGPFTCDSNAITTTLQKLCNVNKIDLIKGTLAWHTRKTQKGYTIITNHRASPQVMKVLLDRSFLFTLSQALHLNMATDGVQDIRM